MINGDLVSLGGGGGGGLPSVTSSDNGKVLGVVNGNWAATAVPNELPTVTSSDNGKFVKVLNGQYAVVSVPSANGVSF